MTRFGSHQMGSSWISAKYLTPGSSNASHVERFTALNGFKSACYPGLLHLPYVGYLDMGEFSRRSCVSFFDFSSISDFFSFFGPSPSTESIFDLQLSIRTCPMVVLVSQCDVVFHMIKAKLIRFLLYFVLRSHTFSSIGPVSASRTDKVLISL